MKLNEKTKITPIRAGRKENIMQRTFDVPPKAGDKVVRYRARDGKLVRVLCVTKVTPTGIVRTDEGESFKPDREGNWYNYSGGSWNGGIVPYTQEAVTELEQAQMINDALVACGDMHSWAKTMSPEVASMILEAYKNWKRDNGVE